LAILLVIALAGCGSDTTNQDRTAVGSGSSTSSATSSGAGTTGSLAVEVRFAAAKDVPADTTVVRLHVVSASTGQDLVPPVTQARTTGAVQVIVVSGIPAGAAVVLLETVDGSGAVTGLNASPVSVEAGAEVTDVVASVQTVRSVVLTPSSASVEIGATATLTLLATLSDDSNANITSLAAWSSSAASIATVSDASGSKGVVTGVAAGSGLVNATYEAFSASTPITVGGGQPNPSPSPTASPTPSPTTVNVTDTSLDAWKQTVSGVTLLDAAYDPDNGTTVGVGKGGCIVTLDALGTVTYRISGTLNDLNSVAYHAGLGRFVAVGGSGTILSSSDGATWTPVTGAANPAPSNVPLMDVIAYTNGTAQGFIAVGGVQNNKGYILHSTDGATFTDISLAGNAFAYEGAAFGFVGPAPGTPFVEIVSATSNANVRQQLAADSPPTAAWTTLTNTNAGARAVTFAQSGTSGFFVLGGDNGWVDVNVDGLAWTPSSAPQITLLHLNPNIVGVAYAKVGSTDTLMLATSNLGFFVDNTFTAPNLNHSYASGNLLPKTGSGPVGAVNLQSVRNSNGKLLMAATNNTLASSTDGIDFFFDTYHAGVSVRGVATGTVGNAPLYVAVGNNDPLGGFGVTPLQALIQTSTDGITWTRVADSKVSNDDLTSVCFGNGRFVAINSHGVVTTSSDGVSWTLATTPPTNHKYLGVTFGFLGSQGTYVAVGNGWVATSGDGLVWSETNVGAAGMNGVAYGRIGATDTFVAVANGGSTSWSTDLQNWTTVASSQTDDLYAVAFDGTRFIAVGANGRVQQSADGQTFTDVGAFSDATHAFRGVAYASTPNGSGAFTGYVAVGDSGAVYTSTDATTWSANTKAAGLNGQNLRAVTVGTTMTSALDTETNVTTNSFTNLFVAVGNNNTVLIDR
jgi:hypothetical protein